MALTKVRGSGIDADGQEIILDADQDSTLSVDTDDQVDIKIGGNDQVVITTGSTAFKAPDGGNRYALNGMGNSNSAELSLYDSSDAQKVRIGTGADTFFNGGNVGIGTNSPTAKLAVSGTGTVDLGIGSTNAGGAYLYLDGDSNGDFSGSDYSYIGHDTSGQLLIHQDSPSGSDNILFKTNATERMRIDSSGTLLVGTTSATISQSAFGFRVDADGFVTFAKNSASGSSVTEIYGASGRFQTMGDGDAENSSGRFSAISDERYKENIVDANSQWDDIKAIKVRNYNFKEEKGWGTHKQIGVVAQELEASGMTGGLVKTKDDGYKSVATSVLYMKAVKALQEAMARIETLEAKVTALESK